MTNAVILSAGQGKRLSPLTDDRPKCLVEIGGRTILEWQLSALAAAGVRDIAVVTGFCSDSVSAAIKTLAVDARVEVVLNPFYAVADNVGSCWAAKDLFGADTLLMNGDTIFDVDIARRVLREAETGVSVTVDVKDHYDSDDMKVKFEGRRLLEIGKKIEGPFDGESIGMLRFAGDGGALFRTALHRALSDPARLGTWYLSIIDEMAKEGHVGIVRLEGERWCEVDFPTDLPIAEATVATYRRSSAGTPKRWAV
ncbi:MAG: phosphocholine cytidylyltransferase family protein [Pseudomonadota bacterium]